MGALRRRAVALPLPSRTHRRRHDSGLGGTASVHVRAGRDDRMRRRLSDARHLFVVRLQDMSARWDVGRVSRNDGPRHSQELARVQELVARLLARQHRGCIHGRLQPSLHLRESTGRALEAPHAAPGRRLETEGERGRRARARGAWVLLATLLVACRAADVPPHVEAGPVRSPGTDDRGTSCLDVGDVRACWGEHVGGEGCVGATCLVGRPLPDVPMPPSGFRCSGQRSARSCVSRAWNGAPFVCQKDRCVQSPLRMPDNGEWECVEIAGAVVCRALSEAAGIPSGTTDPAFVCDARVAHGERICVDLSPDPPPGLDSWSCRVAYDGGAAARVCIPSKESRIGSACVATSDCPDAAACVGGRCLPEAPKPGCWFDQDCGQGARCRYGSCRAPG